MGSYSRIKPKPKVRREFWRTGKIREDSKGMAALRAAAFHRSEGICECGRPECEALPERLRRVSWWSGQLHHVISRAHGGSDVLENVAFVTRRCHAEITGRPVLEWLA